jgi:ribonucleoside-diphosphate reductase alpha chain
MMEFINRIGHDESARLAEVRGPFPKWTRSIYKDSKPLRNSTVTTIAPTGTISIIAGCSSGIEPLFALVFDRKGSLDGQLTLETYAMFEEIARREGFWTDELAQAVHQHGTVRGVAGMPEKWQAVFGTAHDIAPDWHVRMQGAWQKYTDNAVSKTINLSQDATVEDVARAYRMSYELGCNGITVYRDGSKLGVLHVGSGSATSEPADAAYATEIAARPHALHGVTYEIETPLGTAYITVNEDERGEPLEVFINQGKAGSDIAPLSEAVGKLSTVLLRVPSSMPRRARMQQIINKLRGIGGMSAVGFGPDRTRSLPDALAKVLEQHMASMDQRASAAAPVPIALEPKAAVSLTNVKTLKLSGGFCPDCGTALVHEEGCDKCFTCGYSRC